MRIAIQMDPLVRLNKAFDSSLYLARAALQRGFDVFHYEPQNLRMDIDKGATRVTAMGQALRFTNDWALGEPELLDLASFDIILMRQDPPFDLGYITATHILDHIKKKVRIINDPTGVRNAPEKLVATLFPQLMAPTLVTRDKKAIEEFRTRHGDIIVKPLHSNAGHGIFHIKPDDHNLASLLEVMADMNHEPWMIQKFLPIEQVGDKRIILIDGDPVAVYVRFPAKGDIRGNGRVGATATATTLSARDKEICAGIKSLLQDQGLFFAGIDVIGDYLTEINVTSPTGLVVADQLEGCSGKDSLAELFWDKALA